MSHLLSPPDFEYNWWFLKVVVGNFGVILVAKMVGDGEFVVTIFQIVDEIIIIDHYFMRRWSFW